MPQVVSANRLDDGVVVFLAAGDRWVERLGDAEVFGDKAGAEYGLARGLAAVARNIVVEVQLVEVEQTARGIEARHIRDRIRAAGPTVRLDHGKQAVAG
jgi:hypothetical protein